MRIDYLYNPAGGHPDTEKTYASVAAEAGAVVKTAPGQLIKLSGYTATQQFLQVHDAIAAPANTAVPMWSQATAGAWNFSENLEDLQFANGIYVCVSTTQATKTLGATDTWFNITYR